MENNINESNLVNEYCAKQQDIEIENPLERGIRFELNSLQFKWGNIVEVEEIYNIRNFTWIINRNLRLDYGGEAGAQFPNQYLEFRIENVGFDVHYNTKNGDAIVESINYDFNTDYEIVDSNTALQYLVFNA